MAADPKVKHVPHVTMLQIGQLLYINGELHTYGEAVYGDSPRLIFRKLTPLELGAVEVLVRDMPERTVTMGDVFAVLSQ